MKGVKFNFWKRKMNLTDRIQIFITDFIQVTLVLAFFISLYYFNWITAFLSLLTLFLTFLPAIFEKKYDIDVPVEFELVTVLFIYLAIFLGEIKFYSWFWWWDAMLHTGSGLALGFLGFMILFVLFQGNKIKASPGLIAFFGFCFALALGTLWEIFEFSMDMVFPMEELFGRKMQRTGLIDTMWDLIVDALGALAASFVGYLYLKDRRAFGFSVVMERFVRENKKLFG